MKKSIAITIFIVFSIVSLCMGLTACVTNKEGKVRLIEVTHSVFYAPLYIALNSGYFKDEGLDIELTNGGGADKCMTALLANQADIGLMGPEASIYVKNAGKEDYPITFAQLTNKDGSFLVGREKIDGFDISMMKDKEILGGRRGGVPAMTLEYVLNKKGLIDGKTITINYDIQFDMIIPAFQGGSGDYCTMFEPAASNFVKTGKGYILASIGEYAGNMPYTAFMSMKSFIENNSEKCEKFLKAIIKGMQFLNENDPETCAKVLAPSFNGTDIELLTSAIKAYKEIGAYATTPIMKAEDFNHLQDVIIAAGVIKSKVSFNDMVNNELAQKILDDLNAA